MVLRRHPILGFFGGFLIGFGLAILLVIYGTAPLGAATVLVLVLLFGALGVAAAWVLPARRRPVAVQPAVTTAAPPPEAPPRDEHRP